MKMEKLFKLIACISCIFILTSEVNSECEGIYECLKGFLAGDIGSESDSVIKVFELNHTPVPAKVEVFNDESSTNGSFDLIKKTNSIIDAIKNMFFFGSEENVVVVNYTVFNSNWTVTYNSDVISDTYVINNTDKVNKNIENKYIESNYVYDFPNVHNATVRKYISKNHQKSLTKTVQNNIFGDNFDDESYSETDDNDNLTSPNDYAIIDYVALYEDTTNELVELPITEMPENMTSGILFNKVTGLPINKATVANSTSEGNGTMAAILKVSPKQNEEIATRIGKEASKFVLENLPQDLNEVLDDYAHDEIDDGFTDYPEIDYFELYKDVTYPPEETTIEPSTTVADIGFHYLILPEEAVSLCKSRSLLSMDHVIGLPFDEEKYWDGTFHARAFKNLKKVDIILELTSTANITSNDDNTVVTRINDTTYAIKGLNASEAVNFKVQAQPGESFPFVKKMTLNGREICKEKRNWKPTLLGPSNQAVISPLVSPHKSGAYYCGRSKINYSPLVVKGLPTKEGDYPWHVALFIKNLDTMNWDYSCGGTILHRKTIITAAHCVVDRDGLPLDKSRLLVIAGKYRLYEVDPYQKPAKLSKIIVHENYTNSRSTLTNDLALLISEDRFDYGDYVQPICQWNSQQEEKEIVFQEYGRLVGWGSTENDTLSETLIAASLRVIPDDICLQSRPSFFKRYITDNTFCAGNKNGTSACNGDSGGGLVFPITELDGKQSWYLRGVVSVGVRRAGGLCDPQHYVVFTDVARYRQWIEAHQEL